MFRFMIRDLLWLTVVAAIVCAWHVERREARRQQLKDRVRLTAQEREIKIDVGAGLFHRVGNTR